MDTVLATYLKQYIYNISATIALLGILTAVYYYVIDVYNHWNELCVDQISRVQPFFGNVFSLFTLRRSLAHIVWDMYRRSQTPKARSLYGFYFLRKPALVLRDTNAIRCVLLTKKACFRSFAPPTSEFDPLLADASLFTGYDNSEQWRDRVKVRFTDARLGHVLRDLQRLCERTSDALHAKLNRGAVVSGEYRDVRPLFFTTEFSASLMIRYGLGDADLNSKPAKKVKHVGFQLHHILHSPKRQFQHVYTRYAPWVSRLLRKVFPNQSIVPESTEQIFREAILEYLIQRRSNSLRLQSDNLIEWMYADTNPSDHHLLNNEKITRELFSFYIEIYHVNAVISTFALYYLAYNRKIQSQLRKYILEKLKRPTGELIVTAKVLTEMSFLDAVINETMRLKPVVGVIERACKRTIKLRGLDNKCAFVQPGDTILISLYGLHTDPGYWRHPYRFDPQRFLISDCENASNVAPVIPYIGLHVSRAVQFHWMTLRLLLINIIVKFKVAHPTSTNVFPRIHGNSFATCFRGKTKIRMKSLIHEDVIVKTNECPNE